MDIVVNTEIDSEKRIEALEKANNALEHTNFELQVVRLEVVLKASKERSMVHLEDADVHVLELNLRGLNAKKIAQQTQHYVFDVQRVINNRKYPSTRRLVAKYPSGAPRMSNCCTN